MTGLVAAAGAKETASDDTRLGGAGAAVRLSVGQDRRWVW